MPDTDLTALIEQAESGDWGAAGRLIQAVEHKYGRLAFRVDMFRRSDEQWAVRLLYLWGVWKVAPTLSAAIARAARAALEGV